MKYNAIIVEDEILLAQQLLNLITSNCQEISISGIAINGKEAENMIKTLKPDLVFMDVVLPDMNAFDLLEKFKDHTFDLIFTTAHDHYAVQAFDHNTIHYISKPITKDKIIKAVEKFTYRKKELQKPDIEDILRIMKQLDQNDKKIRLPSMNGFAMVGVKQIVRLEAEGRYTKIFRKDAAGGPGAPKPELISVNIKEFEDKLSTHNFFRTHHSHLVNLDYVKSYVKGKGGILKMETGEDVPVARDKKDELLKRLNDI
jgi:two-component system LytT family response regulator